MRASISAQGPGAGAAPEAPHAGRPIILVADDDEDILKFIEVNLRAHGHAVVTASDGETALALALEHRPALVLLDIVIPGVDGYEVCRRLRSDWRFGDPSEILLTGRSLPADRNIGLAAGADDFIVKPFDPVELVSRVNLVLRRLEQVRSASPRGKRWPSSTSTSTSSRPTTTTTASSGGTRRSRRSPGSCGTPPKGDPIRSSGMSGGTTSSSSPIPMSPNHSCRTSSAGSKHGSSSCMTGRTPLAATSTSWTGK